MTNQPAPSPALLGARIRPTDPKEFKYRLTIPTLPDMTKVVSIAAFAPPVGPTQVGGSCTGQTIAGIMAMLWAIKTGTWAEPVDPYVVYWLARVAANWFGEPPGSDTGAELATAFDVAIDGVPRDVLWPTPASMAEEPPADVLTDAPHQDWLAGHQPMYASDPGGFAAGIWTALGNYQPVALALAWYNNWFDHHEILPTNTGGLAGYHAIKEVATIPAGLLHEDELHVCLNSWGGYTDVRQLKEFVPEAQPGYVAIPGRFFRNGTVLEVRAATAEQIVIPDADCADEILNAHHTDESIVLRVRDQYRTQTARNALTKAAQQIHNQG